MASDVPAFYGNHDALVGRAQVGPGNSQTESLQEI